jgi:UDP-glucose:(heptosyl)LPS alpha-1,3-glucosyltransferase
MKIGFVRRGHSATGGAEAYLMRVAAALRELGQETSLITTADWPAERWSDGEIQRIPGKSLEEFSRAFRDLKTGCDVHFSLERVPGCEVFRAGDGVHAAWLQRRDGFDSLWKRLTRWTNRKHSQILRLEREVFDPANTKAVIANSKMVREEILARFSFPSDRVHVIYNGITSISSSPTRAEARRIWDIPEIMFCPLFLGTGWERKGLATAIRAADCLEETTLLVAGRGVADRYRGTNVRFLGPVKDIASLFAASDILVLPTWYDPFSNACLEALAAGLPVITTDANGFSEIIEPGVHGDITSAGDAHELAEVLESWRSNDRCAEAREACLQLASQFSIEKNATETLRVLQSVRATRPKGGSVSSSDSFNSKNH